MEIRSYAECTRGAGLSGVAAGRALPPPETSSMPHRPPTIVLAGDDPAVRASTARALHGQGCERLVELGGVAELIGYLRVRTQRREVAWLRPDPILLLLHLEAACGESRALLSTLKSDAEWRRLPVVVVLCDASAEHVGSYYDAGANAVVAAADADALAQRVVAFWAVTARLPGG